MVLGGILGGLGDLLGGLGGLLGHLGIPWVDFYRFKPNKARWGAELGSIWEPKMEPKSTKKRTRIEDKNQDKKIRSLRSSWSRLGSILGRLVCRLGVIFNGFVLVFILFRGNRRF